MKVNDLVYMVKSMFALTNDKEQVSFNSTIRSLKVQEKMPF